MCDPDHGGPSVSREGVRFLFFVRRSSTRFLIRRMIRLYSHKGSFVGKMEGRSEGWREESECDGWREQKQLGSCCKNARRR